MTEKNDEKLQDLWTFITSHGAITEQHVQFGPIYALDKKEEIRIWSIYASFKQDAELVTLQENDIYTDMGLPTIGSYWTVSGIETGKLITSEPTIVTEGKNIGKKNQTSPLVQTLLVVKSEWESKIKDGYVTDRDAILDSKAITFDKLVASKTRGMYPWRIQAMLLHSLKIADANTEKPVENWKKISYSCYIQPKLDGILTLMVYHPKISNVYDVNKYVTAGDYYETLKPVLDAEYANLVTDMKIDKFTRTGETVYSCGNVNLAYALVAKEFPGLYIVGEMYKKGMALQDISGIIRSEKDKADHEKLEFHVFDCFYLEKPQQPFSERIAILDQVVKKITTALKKISPDIQIPIKLVPTKVVKSREEIVEKFNDYIQKGLEGAVVRNRASTYEFSLGKPIRSTGTLKLKLRPDSEWPVLNFDCGTTGKEVGAVIWICSVLPDPAEKEEELHTFHVVPNLPLNYRKQIYTYLSTNRDVFNERIKGKLLTIEYSIISKDRAPQQPKAIRFRDSEVEDFLKMSVTGGVEAVRNPVMDSLIMANIKRISTAEPVTFGQVKTYLTALGTDIAKYMESMDTNGLITEIFNNYVTIGITTGNIVQTQLIDTVKTYITPKTRMLYCTGYYDDPNKFRDIFSGYQVDVVDHTALNAFKSGNPSMQYDLIVLNYYLQKINIDQFYSNIRSYLNPNGKLIIVDQNAYKRLPELHAVYKLTDIVRYMLYYITTFKNPTYNTFVERYKNMSINNYQFAEDIINAMTNIDLIESDTPPIGMLNNQYVLVYIRRII